MQCKNCFKMKAVFCGIWNLANSVPLQNDVFSFFIVIFFLANCHFVPIHTTASWQFENNRSPWREVEEMVCSITISTPSTAFSSRVVNASPSGLLLCLSALPQRYFHLCLCRCTQRLDYCVEDKANLGDGGRQQWRRGGGHWGREGRGWWERVWVGRNDEGVGWYGHIWRENRIMYLLIKCSELGQWIDLRRMGWLIKYQKCCHHVMRLCSLVL